MSVYLAIIAVVIVVVIVGMFIREVVRTVDLDRRSMKQWDRSRDALRRSKDRV